MSTPAAPAAPARPARAGRGRGPLLLAGVGGALLALAAGAPAWVDGAVQTAAGAREVVATGRQAGAAATALALVALAAVVACSLGRRVARALAALVLVAAGAGVAASAASVLLSPQAAISAPARQVSGRSDPQVLRADARAWPAVCALGGALAAAAGAGVLVRGRSWSASSRHERDAAAPAGPPTGAAAGARAAAGTAAPARGEQAPAGGGAAPAAGDPAAAWDSLTRGEDPTR
ncbi:Trp biosynthesis-associated membrane protein [Kineococcus gypseus]|uniref:Trp biosynthesis-associated membrane protein n=1 Tax=Kineococcus gypseus TaxID=1637102 RepID=UPI003D7E8406